VKNQTPRRLQKMKEMKEKEKKVKEGKKEKEKEAAPLSKKDARMEDEYEVYEFEGESRFSDFFREEWW
jgi:hypothetical protein